MPGARTAATVVLVACATTLLAALPAAGAAGQEPRPAAGQPVAMLRTWAVLASEELRKSGLEDQVLAGLGADKTMTLVDREHLDLVARELALASLLDSSGAGFRRKAGAAVKADALAILNHEFIEGNQYVRLVVCETRGGARLRVELIALEDGKSDEAGKAIVSAIQNVRKHFAQGVKRVYGVPPFVSRCLTHEYDHLQRGYSSLLANALSQQPGVAVIEVEEARQIAREIGLTSGEDVQRIVPLFIEGEYEVTRNPDDKEPTVAIRIKISGSREDERILSERKIRLSEAVKYVGVELPNVLAGLEKPGPPEPLTFEQQAEALVSRADVFARLGAWEHSTGLREAALLLSPDDAVQRERVIDEYLRKVSEPLPPEAALEMNPAKEPYGSFCRERWPLWHIALAHLEYLIRNGEITAGKAGSLTNRLLSLAPDGSAVNIRLASADLLAEAQAAKHRFLHDVFPLILNLKSRADQPIIGWQSNFRDLVGYRLDRSLVKKEDFDLVYDMMENILPENDCVGCLYLYTPHSVGFKQEDYLDFLSRLEQSKRPINAIGGRFGKLYWAWHKEERGTPVLAEQFLPEVRAIVATLEAHPSTIANTRTLYHRDLYHDALATLNEIQDLLKAGQAPPAAVPAAPSPPFAPPVVRPTGPASPPAAPAPQVTYEEIALQVRDLSGKVAPLQGKRWPTAHGYFQGWGLRLLNCGNFDVVWEEGVLLLHREKGILEEALVEPEAKFGDVKWDGKHIWAGARSGEIFVLSSQGKEILRVTAKHGLPPCDRALLLHPMGQDRAIAIGSFGPHRRLWCGIVEIGADGPKVNLFHQATRVKTPEDLKGDEQPDWASVPEWVHEHQWSKDGPKVLLVGRSSLPGVADPHPLEIDLSTLKVITSKATVFRYTGSAGMYSHDGYLVQTLNHYPVLVAPPGRVFENGENFRYLGKIEGSGGSPHAVLFWKGRLYVPGWPWFRIKPGTWETERLACERLGLGHIWKQAVSAHYGMVVWGTSDNPWYRVIVADADVAGSGS